MDFMVVRKNSYQIFFLIISLLVLKDTKSLKVSLHIIAFHSLIRKKKKKNKKKAYDTLYCDYADKRIIWKLRKNLLMTRCGFTEKKTL